MNRARKLSMFQRILYYSSNPVEIGFLIQMKKQFKAFKPSAFSLNVIGERTTDEEFCMEALKKVSRSFSVVIHQLPKELRMPVGLFYLILRGLDTVEDDMNIGSEYKSSLLKNFATRINTEAFTLENIGDTQDYRDLMLNFDKVVREYQKLAPEYQVVITDITERMAFGMEKYVHLDVVSFEDWDDYCHYVAGLVGIGLSKLFLASGLEKAPEFDDESLSNHMGLFLQKTNIIRDYAEDLGQDRQFWPQQAWNGRVNSLHELQSNPETGVLVVNDLVINALTHIPACLKYMKAIQDEKIFRFCAIPQLMAIATLCKLYDNKDVLAKNVKIHKGRTARYFMSKQNYQRVKNTYITLLESLYQKSNSPKIKQLINQINQK
jgi:farnesyl-diphosphate farnesyltransferase